MEKAIITDCIDLGTRWLCQPQKVFCLESFFYVGCCCGLRGMKVQLMPRSCQVLQGCWFPMGVAGLGSQGLSHRPARSSQGTPGQPQLWSSGMSLGLVWRCGLGLVWSMAGQGGGELEMNPAAALLGQGLMSSGADMASWAIGRCGEHWGAGQGLEGPWVPSGPWQT